MKKTIVEQIVLTADEGMTLTNGETYGKKVFLAHNTTADNWREITDSEAEALQKEKENEYE